MVLRTAICVSKLVDWTIWSRNRRFYFDFVNFVLLSQFSKSSNQQGKQHKATTDATNHERRLTGGRRVEVLHSSSLVWKPNCLRSQIPCSFWMQLCRGRYSLELSGHYRSQAGGLDDYVVFVGFVLLALLSNHGCLSHKAWTLSGYGTQVGVEGHSLVGNFGRCKSLRSCFSL